MNKSLDRRLTKLESLITPKSPPAPEPEPMTEAEWQDFIFSWLRWGHVIFNPKTHRFEPAPFRHKETEEEATLIADGLNEWQAVTDSIFIPLTGSDIAKALDYIERGYFKMSHCRAGYDIVICDYIRHEYDSTANESSYKVKTAVELFCHQRGLPQPTAIEQVEQLLTEWQQGEL